MTNVNEDMIWKITPKTSKLRCHIPSAIFTSFPIHCVIYFILSSIHGFTFKASLNEKSLRLKSEQMNDERG